MEPPRTKVGLKGIISQISSSMCIKEQQQRSSVTPESREAETHGPTAFVLTAPSPLWLLSVFFREITEDENRAYEECFRWKVTTRLVPPGWVLYTMFLFLQFLRATAAEQRYCLDWYKKFMQNQLNRLRLTANTLYLLIWRSHMWFSWFLHSVCFMLQFGDCRGTEWEYSLTGQLGEWRVRPCWQYRHRQLH